MKASSSSFQEPCLPEVTKHPITWIQSWIFWAVKRLRLKRYHGIPYSSRGSPSVNRLDLELDIYPSVNHLHLELGIYGRETVTYKALSWYSIQ